MSRNKVSLGLPALLCAGLAVWSVPVLSEETPMSCEAGVDTSECRSCIADLEGRFGERLIAHLCGVPTGMALPETGGDEAETVTVDPVDPPPDLKPGSPEEAPDEVTVAFEETTPALDETVPSSHVVTGESGPTAASFRESNVVENGSFVAKVARISATTDCRDFTRSVAAAVMDERGASPEFQEVHNTCQAMNIYGRDVERDDADRVTFGLGLTLATLSDRIGGFLDQGPSLHYCDREMPDAGLIDALTEEVVSVRASARVFLSCGQWYETLGRCLFDADVLRDGEEATSTAADALAGYREWVNEWERDGPRIAGELEELIEEVETLRIQRKVIGC